MYRKFVGIVDQIRLNPDIFENVVTYNVIAVVNNDDGALLLRMTVTTNFVVNQKEAVLYVPNAALRYNPNDTGSPHGRVSTKKVDGRVICRLKNGIPKPTRVVAGITNENVAEIVDGQIKKGGEVIISEVKKSAASGHGHGGGGGPQFRMF